MTSQVFLRYQERLQRLHGSGPVGRVAKVVGLTVEAQGPPAALGEACAITTRTGKETLAEVVGFRDGRVLLMPWETLEGISAGAAVRSTAASSTRSAARSMISVPFPRAPRKPASRATCRIPRAAAGSAKPWPPAFAFWTPSPPAGAASASASSPAAAWARAACSA